MTSKELETDTCDSKVGKLNFRIDPIKIVTYSVDQTNEDEQICPRLTDRRYDANSVEELLKLASREIWPCRR